MLGTLGGPELILILVIALVVFGPRKLPDIGRSVGRMMAEFRRASNDFRRTLEDEVEAERVRPPVAAAPATLHPDVLPPFPAAPQPDVPAPPPATSPPGPAQTEPAPDAAGPGRQ